MSEMNLIVNGDDDDQLDRLLQKVQLEEPDSDGGNSDDNISQVLLFAAVGSPTEEPLTERNDPGTRWGEQMGTAPGGRSLPATSPVFHPNAQY